MSNTEKKYFIENLGKFLADETEYCFDFAGKHYTVERNGDLIFIMPQVLNA